MLQLFLGAGRWHSHIKCWFSSRLGTRQKQLRNWLHEFDSPVTIPLYLQHQQCFISEKHVLYLTNWNGSTWAQTDLHGKPRLSKACVWRLFRKESSRIFFFILTLILTVFRMSKAGVLIMEFPDTEVTQTKCFYRQMQWIRNNNKSANEISTCTMWLPAVNVLPGGLVLTLNHQVMNQGLKRLTISTMFIYTNWISAQAIPDVVLMFGSL